MWKFALKFSFIILGNLFAFLMIWYILDTIFETRWLYLVISLVLSVFSLVWISYVYIGSYLKEINKLDENIDNKEKNK